MWMIAILVAIFDQITKHVALSNLVPSVTNYILGDYFHFTLTFNTGAAFGIFRNMNSFFIMISLAVAGFIIYKFDDLPNPKLPIGFIFGGLIGNLIDRLVFSHVIDFIGFGNFPLFNVADMCISLGTLSWIVLSEHEEKNKKDHPRHLKQKKSEKTSQSTTHEQAR